jgi:hypothetical protein
MVWGNTQKYRHCLCARSLYRSVRSPLYKVLFAILKHQTILKQFPPFSSLEDPARSAKSRGSSATYVTSGTTHSHRFEAISSSTTGSILPFERRYSSFPFGCSRDYSRDINPSKALSTFTQSTDSRPIRKCHPSSNLSPRSSRLPR